jgi:hypothetical protein
MKKEDMKKEDMKEEEMKKRRKNICELGSKSSF